MTGDNGQTSGSQDENVENFKKKRIGIKHYYRRNECGTSEKIQILRSYYNGRW